MLIRKAVQRYFNSNMVRLKECGTMDVHICTFIFQFQYGD